MSIRKPTHLIMNSRSHAPRLWHWLILMIFTGLLTFVSLINYVTVRAAVSMCSNGDPEHAFPQTASLRNSYLMVRETDDSIRDGRERLDSEVLQPVSDALRRAPQNDRNNEPNIGENINEKLVDKFEQYMKKVYPAAAPNSNIPASEAPITPLPKRRIILTISTGHTGTMWLVRVLRCTRHPIVAEHEPKPSLVSFHKLLRYGKAETYEERKAEKWQTFLYALNNATQADGSIYAEISHMFIKSWADLFTDWLSSVDPKGERFDVDIVVLRRYLPHVIRSFLTDRNTWLPTFNLQVWSGGEYTIHHRNFAILPPLLDHGAEDSVDMVLGYLVDMELQYARFRAKFPRFRYIDVRSEELFTPAGARRVLGVLGLHPVTEKCMNILANAKPVNQHVSWKGPHMLNVTTDVFIARFQLYRLRYTMLGLPFPEMPQARQYVPCQENSTVFCEVPEPNWTAEELEAIVSQNFIPNNISPVKAFELRKPQQGK